MPAGIPSSEDLIQSKAREGSLTDSEKAFLRLGEIRELREELERKDQEIADLTLSLEEREFGNLGRKGNKDQDALERQREKIERLEKENERLNLRCQSFHNQVVGLYQRIADLERQR